MLESHEKIYLGFGIFCGLISLAYIILTKSIL